jgi:pSer/pThr/pTyr-binding forkhead associated (FHA) protein
MPPNPKRPGPRDVPIREEHILKADDPRPQRVPQYPSAGAMRSTRPPEEHVPTSVFDTEAADREMQAEYGVPEAMYKPAFLYVERGPGAGQLLEVKQGTVVIGRASVSDLRLQHPSVSRRHAQVRRQGEQFFVRDLGSQNGTFVNKQRLATEVEVKPGDTLAVGNAVIRLRGPIGKDEKLPSVTVKPPRPRLDTAVVPRQTGPHRPGSNALKVAVFAGAVGFGLAAVLAVALVKTVSGRETPAQAAAPTPSATADERSRLIDEAIKRKMAEQASAAKVVEAAPAADTDAAPVQDLIPVVRVAPPLQATPKVEAAPVVRAVPAPAPAPRVAKAKAAAAVDEAFGDDEPASAKPAASGAKRTQILASYEKGNAEASLEAAKAAGDRELTDKLTRFVAAYDAANDAMMANNGTGAITNFKKALQLDEQLSSGWGKYGAEIRRQLANLYVLVGLKFVSDGQPDKGKQAFQAAVQHDPSNQRARAQLEKLGEGKAAEGKTAEGALDESDGDKPAAPRRAVKPKASASAIDDAFGD